MTRRTTIITVVVAALAAVVFGSLTAWLGTPGLVITIVCCALALVSSRVYLIYGTPRRVHKAMLAELDPLAGPPGGAQPATSDLFDRMQTAARASDWPALRSLLTDDFSIVDPKGRRYDARGYVRTLTLMRRAYPDLRSDTEAILADPTDPDVLWLRSHTLGHPRSGPTLDVTSWSRLTTAEDGARARELANGGVIRVG